MKIENCVRVHERSWQHSDMGKIVGIDLGTTNSLVAVVDSGIPLVIADNDGKRLTPSVVHFPAPGAAPVVGHAANRARVLNPAETVYSVKRFTGRRGSEIAQEEMLVTYPIKGEGAGPVTIDIHGHGYTPEEVSVMPHPLRMGTPIAQKNSSTSRESAAPPLMKKRSLPPVSVRRNPCDSSET